MNGGMSFHGAGIGAIVAGVLVCKRIDKNFFQAMIFPKDSLHISRHPSKFL